MKILLFLPEQEISEKVSFSLEAKFSAKVEEVHSLEEVNNLLSSGPKDYDLIILNHKDALIPTALILKERLSQIPGIQISNSPLKNPAKSDWKTIGTAAPATLLTDLIRIIENSLQTGALTTAGSTPLSSSAEPSQTEYCRIKTKLLLSVYPLKADIFIKLSETKYIKLFREGDAFEAGDLEKYTLKKGVIYLYIKKAETQEFIEKYNADLQKYLKPSYSLGITEMIDLNESIHETVQELTDKVGLTKPVQELVKTHLRMSMRAIGDSPTLNVVLNRINKFQGKYIYAHSMLTSYLACAIASRMQWASPATFHKLNFAALLHDITLDSHELASCDNLDEAKQRNFSPEKFQEFRDHPSNAAALAGRFSEAPPDVDTIILQHHERPDGKGFPRGITGTYVFPISAIFIVAHRMARMMIAQGENFQVDTAKTELQKEFNVGHFKKVIAVLDKL